MLLLGVAMMTVALRGCDLAFDLGGGTSWLHLERSLAELLEAVTHPILTLVNLHVGFIIRLAYQFLLLRLLRGWCRCLFLLMVVSSCLLLCHKVILKESLLALVPTAVAL